MSDGAWENRTHEQGSNAMDNQHRKISGYRELREDEIDLMNLIKEHGKILDELCDNIASVGGDGRWLAIGKTDLQKGMMALTRSIAKPDFF